jgi:transcriptional regulator with PAS, ATPase and Fis domain
MQTVRRQIERFAPTDATILITGENGTGKDVLANEIHRLSDSAMRPMVCVDAGAITETLFESELFGHVKGAFTDAHADKIGKFEQANGGTLFLDEIGNIPLHLQAKLLRVLQNRAVTRVGDTKERPIDIRLICATNKDIPQMVQEGTFREDLYYRINTLHVQLPPLRQRTDEILPLAERFVNLYAEKYHRAVASVSAEAAKLLLAHSWSGNIRELQNCIEKAVILSDGVELLSSDIQLQTTSSQSGGKFANGGGLSYSPPVLGGTNERSKSRGCLHTMPCKEEVAEGNAVGGGGSQPLETLEAAEERIIRAAMNQYDGNLSLVAKSLDISRPTLYAKLKKYGI